MLWGAKDRLLFVVMVVFTDNPSYLQHHISAENEG